MLFELNGKWQTSWMSSVSVFKVSKDVIQDKEGLLKMVVGAEDAIKKMKEEEENNRKQKQVESDLLQQMREEMIQQMNSKMEDLKNDFEQKRKADRKASDDRFKALEDRFKALEDRNNLQDAMIGIRELLRYGRNQKTFKGKEALQIQAIIDEDLHPVCHPRPVYSDHIAWFEKNKTKVVANTGFTSESLTTISKAIKQCKQAKWYQKIVKKKPIIDEKAKRQNS